MVRTDIGLGDSRRPTSNARLRAAVELKFLHPGESWTWVAEQLGCGRKTLWTWRHSEEWEAAWRDLAVEHMAELVPHAQKALIKAWESGRAEREALEVLRGYQLVAPETVRHENVNVEELRDRIRSRIEALVSEREEG